MSMTAALMMTSCSSDDVQDWPTPTTKTIPYTVTVSQGTRATVDDDLSTLRLAEGDKLCISGTNVSSTLHLKSGEGDTQATFSGNLTYTGAGDPADNLSLTATLVSAQQSGTEVTYPTDKYCATVEEAVQKYSKLTGTSTYGSRSFQLSQGTAFLNFKITFVDGTTTGTTLPAVFKNNGTELSRANVTTTTENGKVVAKFVLPVAGGTTLTKASVKFGDKGSVVINNATVTGKVYNVNKKLGGFSINANDDRVFFAPGNLQATYDGSNWTWAFAEHEWDYIGNAPGNASLTVSEPFISENGTVDLFGWVGKSSTWTGVNMFGITSSAYESLTITDGYGNVVGEAMKAEWNSTNLGSITRGGTYAWRTLTADEWYYVLATRKVTVNGESKASYGHGHVNGVNGVILLPDGWDGSVDGGFTYGSTDDENGYTNNTYSTTSTPTWSQMEAAGCAFLPAAGERYGASVNLVGADGGYWSSTAYPSFVDWACRVFFMSGRLDAGHTNFRNIAQAVRLVRPAE